MSKEELLKLMQKERPSQRLLEVVDFRESKSGIEGVLYDVDVLIQHQFRYDSYTNSLHKNMPYPLKPFKDYNDKKIKEMMEKNKDVVKKWLG